MSEMCQFRKSQRERYRTEIDCDFFALQAAIDQIGLLGRLITYLVQEFCEWRGRRQAEERKRAAEFLAALVDWLCQVRPPVVRLCAAVTAAS